MIREAIEKVGKTIGLSEAQMREVFEEIMSGKAASASSTTGCLTLPTSMTVAVGANLAAMRRTKPARLWTGAASKTNDAPAAAASALSAISSTTPRVRASGPAWGSTS